jgi:hypothetical protein
VLFEVEVVGFEFGGDESFVAALITYPTTRIVTSTINASNGRLNLGTQTA